MPRKFRDCIVVVDDSLVILKAAKDLLKDHYDVFTMTDGPKLFHFLSVSETLPSAILLDVMMPPPNGYDVASQLKRTPLFADIPLIFLTAQSDAESELHGLSLGAVDYIVKPFSPPLLLKRLELHIAFQRQKQKLQFVNANLSSLVKQKIKAVLGMQRALLTSVADLIEFRDDNTGNHVERTGKLLDLFLEELSARKIYETSLKNLDFPLLVESSKLHDVGKIAIRDSILLKPDMLTQEEIEEMRRHASIGEDIIAKIQLECDDQENDFLNYAKVMAGTHHERWDGNGYPRRLAGENIPLMGRMMAFADVYDALISRRPYKKPLTHREALDIITREGGKHFDPILLEAFNATADRFQDNLSCGGLVHEASKLSQ